MAWPADNVWWIAVPVLMKGNMVVLAFPSGVTLPDDWSTTGAQVAAREGVDVEVVGEGTVDVQLAGISKRRLGDFKLVSGGHAPAAEGFGLDDELPHAESLVIVAQQWLQGKPGERFYWFANNLG